MGGQYCRRERLIHDVLQKDTEACWRIEEGKRKVSQESVRGKKPEQFQQSTDPAFQDVSGTVLVEC